MVDKSKFLLFKKNAKTGRIDFHEGLNITVRRGIKWALQDGANDITLCDAAYSNNNLIDGIIKDYKIIEPIKTFNYRLADLTEDILKYEHDPMCQTNEGLLNVMKCVYGDGFDKNEIVTVVKFVVEKAV